VQRIVVSVCLWSACISQKAVVLMLIWPWLGPPLTALRFIMYFRFCRWRLVLHNGPYGASCVLNGERMALTLLHWFQSNFTQWWKTNMTMSRGLHILGELRTRGEVCCLSMSCYNIPVTCLLCRWAMSASRCQTGRQMHVLLSFILVWSRRKRNGKRIHGYELNVLHV